MILADKIIDLRKKNGWSQEELAEKLGVSRQAISKWEGAQSIPDLTRVVQMAQLFGVSTDYLLMEEQEMPVPVETPTAESSVRTVTMEEANAFLDLRDRNAARISIGVMLCVLSPVLLILLAGGQDTGALPMTEGQAAGIGMTALFLLIGAAVALFVTSGLRSARFEYLEEEPLETLYGVAGLVRDRRERFRPTFTRQLTVGIVLCAVSALAVMVPMIFAEENEFAYIVGTAVLLCMVAFGVLLIVRVSIVWSAFHILLEEGDYTRAEKLTRAAHAPFGKIYWGLVTAAYLALSFYTGAWDRSWIIWPVTAVAYGAVFGIARALRRKDS